MEGGERVIPHRLLGIADREVGDAPLVRLIETGISSEPVAHLVVKEPPDLRAVGALSVGGRGLVNPGDIREEFVDASPLVVSPVLFHRRCRVVIKRQQSMEEVFGGLVCFSVWVNYL